MEFVIGSTITVSVECSYAPTSPLYTPPHSYTGVVITHRAAGSDQLALTTGLPDFPVRVLQKRKIISVNGSRLDSVLAVAPKPTRTVMGSKGQTYRVNTQGCSCTGYTYRGTCKHHKEYLNEAG